MSTDAGTFTHLGDTLIVLRSLRGLSQAELAARAEAAVRRRSCGVQCLMPVRARMPLLAALIVVKWKPGFYGLSSTGGGPKVT